jgi:hypothetical protein
MKVFHKNILLFVATLTTFAANAQISDESVDIIKDFEVQLLESFKLNVSASLPPLDTTTKQQQYLVPAHPLNVSYNAPTLKPIGMKTVPPPDPFRGFGKIGAGVPNQLWGEGGYYFGSPDNFDGVIWARHHSGNNDKQQENQRFQNNDVKGNATFYLDNNLAIGANAGVSFDRLHYYGYNDDEISFEEAAVRQKFNTFDLGVDLFNTAPNAQDLSFWVKPRFYNLKDNFSNVENAFHFDAGATKWFAEKHPLRVNLRGEMNNYKDTLTQKLNNLAIQPSFTYHADIFKVKAGVNLLSSTDGFHVFPDVEGNLRIWGDGIQLFVGASGDLRQNTMRTLTEYNPWLSIRGSTIRNTRFTDFYGGIKGNLRFFEYHIRGAYSFADDLALIQTRFRTANGVPVNTTFVTDYDNASIYSIRFSGKLVPFQNFTVTGSFSQNIYDMDTAEKAWGLPSTEGNFGLVYTLLEDKLALKSNLYVADDIPFLDENGNSTATNSLFDLNFGAHFYFLENIGAFVEFNNVLNNKRERWYNYPMFGTNFLAGIQARF